MTHYEKYKPRIRHLEKDQRKKAWAKRNIIKKLNVYLRDYLILEEKSTLQIVLDDHLANKIMVEI